MSVEAEDIKQWLTEFKQEVKRDIKELGHRVSDLEKGSSLTGFLKPESLIQIVVVSAALIYYVTRVESENRALRTELTLKQYVCQMQE